VVVFIEGCHGVCPSAAAEAAPSPMDDDRRPESDVEAAVDLEMLQRLILIENEETAFDNAAKEGEEKIKEFDDQVRTASLLCCALLCSALLCCVVLLCAVFCCTVLYWAVLCCANVADMCGFAVSSVFVSCRSTTRSGCCRRSRVPSSTSRR
jgi:hypothetical protein